MLFPGNVLQRTCECSGTHAHTHTRTQIALGMWCVDVNMPAHILSPAISLWRVAIDCVNDHKCGLAGGITAVECCVVCALGIGMRNARALLASDGDGGTIVGSAMHLSAGLARARQPRVYVCFLCVCVCI